jgi:hypothetical protein
MPVNKDGRFLRVHFNGPLNPDVIFQENCLILKLFAGGSYYIRLEFWHELAKIAKDFLVPALTNFPAVSIDGWGNMRLRPVDYHDESDRVVISVWHAKVWHTENIPINFICNLGDRKRFAFEQQAENAIVGKNA